MPSKIEGMPSDPSPITRVDGPQDAAKFEDAVGWAKEANRNVRMRVEFRLYKPQDQRYTSWPGASWTLDVEPDNRVGEQLLKIFELVSIAMTTIGPERTMQALQELVKP